MLKDLFTKLVEKANALKLVDGEHISIDSTKLGSFEASKPKKQIVDDGSNLNWGMKRDNNGTTLSGLVGNSISTAIQKVNSR